MKRKAAGYGHLFPRAQLSIKVNRPTKGNIIIGPSRLSDLIQSVFGVNRALGFLKVSHLPLAKYVQVVIFDGLDESRFQAFLSQLSAFASLACNGFPITVKAEQKGGCIIPGIKTLIGFEEKRQNSTVFKSFDQMLATPEQLVDNGFPLRGGPVLTGKLRFEYFRLPRLSDDDLAAYEELPPDVPNCLPLIAIDCEMIETSFGDECARLSVVDASGTVVLDEFYRPIGDIIDLRTGISGITSELIGGASLTSSEVVKSLSRFASRMTIIVGHSLENDFRAMKLIHSRVIDMSLVYHQYPAYPRKPSLGNLYANYIGRPFRQDADGRHDSVEDARAALELAHRAMKLAFRIAEPRPILPRLFQTLKPMVAQIKVFASRDHKEFAGLDDQVRYVICDSSEEICARFTESIVTERAPLSIACFGDLAKCEINEDIEKEICMKYNAWMERIREQLPLNSIAVVYTGVGNAKRLQADRKTLDPRWQMAGRDPNRVEEFEKCRRGLAWVICTGGPPPDGDDDSHERDGDSHERDDGSQRRPP
jgi:RNA exonuclease 1